MVPIRVWIQGNVWSGNIRAMLARFKDPQMKFIQADTLAQSDMVLYTGGADVSPKLYGEDQLPCTSTDPQRDIHDYHAFNTAKAMGITQVGICRGSQFLNVCNGGTLWQDVDGHATGKAHFVTCELTGKNFLASSTHHQASILAPGSKLLAYSLVSNRKKSAKGGWVGSSGARNLDVEAFWYPSTKCLGVQWHPEIGPEECVERFFAYLKLYHPLKPQEEEKRAA